MKKTILLVKSLMLVGLLVVSCDDDNDIECPNALTGELTATETTFSGEWILKAIVAEKEIDLTDNDIDDPSTDIYAQNSSCQNDLVYNFKSDRSYILKQGANVTTDCEDKSSEGTWALDGDILTVVSYCASQKTNLTFSDDNNEFSYVSTLNFKDVDNDIIISEATFTYEKKQPE